MADLEQPPPRWDYIGKAKALLQYVEDHPDLPVDEKVALWRDAKEAANLLYRICKTLDPDLLRAGAGTRGWQNDGRPVQIKRRFEIALQDPDAFEDWWAETVESEIDPFDRTPKLRKAAKKRIREAILEDGEKPDGVAAGYGGSYLSIGRTR